MGPTMNPEPPTPTVQARARAVLAPAPATSMSEATRTAHKQRMLREARRVRPSDLPVGPGSHDGLEVETHLVTVEHPLLPHGLVMADVEAIDAQRAAEVAERVVDAIVTYCYKS